MALRKLPKPAKRTLSLPRANVTAEQVRTAPAEVIEDDLEDIERPLDDFDHDVTARAAAQLEQKGVHFRKQKIVINPQMPDDITQISDEELGMLSGQMSAMSAWLEEMLGRADHESVVAASYLDHVKAEVRLTKSGTVADKDSKTLNDKRVIAAEASAFQKDAVARLLKAKVRGYDKCYTALSREQTRRMPRE